MTTKTNFEKEDTELIRFGSDKQNFPLQKEIIVP